MHDPMTLAFRMRLFGYEIGHIWHRDPERDGSDDSCGWSRPKLNKEQSAKIKKRAKSEFDYWLKPRNKQAMLGGQPLSVFEVLYWVWACCAFELDKRGFHDGGLTIRELNEIALLSSNPHDNIRSCVIEGVSEYNYETERLFILVARAYLRHHRKWWQHPRWHLHHWKINIHLVSKVKRRLFKRCAECKKPFAWNETPMGNWGGILLWHQNCFYKKNHPTRATEGVKNEIFVSMDLGSGSDESQTAEAFVMRASGGGKPELRIVVLGEGGGGHNNEPDGIKIEALGGGTFGLARHLQERFKHKQEEADTIKNEIVDTRSCSCHPTDAPVPCMAKHALTDCMQAWKDGVSSGEIPVGYLPHQLSVEELKALTTPTKEPVVEHLQKDWVRYSMGDKKQ